MKFVCRICIVATLLLLVIYTFCGCNRSIDNCADELVVSSYFAKLDNGSEISLSFCGDNATLYVKLADASACKISGFCEISDSIFVIYDDKTKKTYAFEYLVHFDSVDIIYEGNTVSLYKV